MMLVFLSSGLFLGWSLGANDAANVFGTAVGTRMIRFKTAATICGIFVILGAVVGGAGAAHTLEKLGSVNAIAGSFMVALATALTVFWMTKLKIPVSTSQGIVGAIVGWNIFSNSLTDYESFVKIVLTWVLCPVLSAIFAIILFSIVKVMLNRAKIHLLRMDMFTRLGLILVGAFGSYSLGANNIANVMGVFVPVTHFPDISFFDLITFSGTQQLFALGGIAITVGVFTYSRNVMETVGRSIFKLSPIMALIVVLAHSMVLFLFSSEGLEHFLASHGLPTIPLVPVSSSQAIVGAVIGIGLLKGGRLIKFKVLGGITLGWVATPIVAGVVAFISLYFFQNVFDQKVFHKISFNLNIEVIKQLEKEGISDPGLMELKNTKAENPATFKSLLRRNTKLTKEQRLIAIEYSRKEMFKIDRHQISDKIDRRWFTHAQIKALENLDGRTYEYHWQLKNDLHAQSVAWQYREQSKINKTYNTDLAQKFDSVFETFRVIYAE